MDRDSLQSCTVDSSVMNTWDHWVLTSRQWLVPEDASCLPEVEDERDSEKRERKKGGTRDRVVKRHLSCRGTTGSCPLLHWLALQ